MIFFSTPPSSQSSSNKNNTASAPEKPVYISVKQFHDRIGMSRSTFYRLLKEKAINPPGRMLSPKEQRDLAEKLDVLYT